jgi:hypothetical protein
MNLPPRFESPSQNGLMSYPPAKVNTQQRQERTKEEVIQLKAARRAEIERRCMSLDPPLTPGVLAHMPSFQAAIQIIQPITDGSWEVLKPRLLSQREEAQQREHDRLAQTRIAQEHSDERRYQDPMARSDSKDLVDREWDDVQAPLRARIGGYADETIYNGWDRGNKVNYETSPKFAADVLIYVRKRFYAEIAKDEAAMRATGREPDLDPPNGPFLRKLVLENMKWVFDTKIKPYTEPYRKELFLCNDPHCGIHSKWYGFEGVIQHYAAKHTSTLSLGSVVVHWKSEWPEYPPFNPDPTTVSNPSYYNAAPGASAPYVGNVPILQQNYGYGGYQPAPVSTPMPGPMAIPLRNPLPVSMQVPMHVSNPHGYQESQAPYYGPPRFGEQFSGHQHGPYPPPQPYQGNSQGYQVQHYSGPPSVNGGYSQALRDYPHQGYNAPYSAASQATYTSPDQGLPYPALIPTVPAQQDTYISQEAHYASNYSQPAPHVNAQPPQKSEEYKAQLKEVGRSVRDTWNAIYSIKEIPGSVKVYTIIHHLLANSRANHDDDPPLAMIIDGLSNNKEMRPARNINGLLCRACVLGLAGSKSNQPKKHFSFPQLLNHFRTIHEQELSKANNSYAPDWKKDMVELPDISKISDIFKGLQKDDQRLRVVTEAIPELILTPVSKYENIRPPSANSYEETTLHQYVELVPGQDPHHNYYSKRSNTEPSNNGNTSYESGEYDPRDPRELPVDVRPVSRFVPPSEGYIGEYGCDSSQEYRVTRHDEDPREIRYPNWREASYVEQKPRPQQLHGRYSDIYERPPVRNEPPTYVDRQSRHRETDERDYRTRPGHPPMTYISQDTVNIDRDYRIQNAESYQENLQDVSQATDATARNRIFEVVAQISQQAQRANGRLPQDIPAETSSEDGEVHAGSATTRIGNNQIRPEAEASNAAERFLNTFLRETPQPDISRVEFRHGLLEGGYNRDYQHTDTNANVNQPREETSRRSRNANDAQARPFSQGHSSDPTRGELQGLKYNANEPPSPAQPGLYAYEDRQGVLGVAQVRERSPELVDRRYKLNNVVYRDERQNSHTTYRTPSRYARYESVRLENDRARSRSPAYVNNLGGQSGYNSVRSPVGPPLPPDSAYRTRSPQPAVEDSTYEKPPRQEYYRIYADDPRPRSPEAYELVRVTDIQGEYVIRRPIRRGPEPIHTPHEAESYSRRPIHESRLIYESRAPAHRSAEPQFEEYDPRHPEPPPIVTIRQSSRY